jgi:hypothetical protein
MDAFAGESLLCTAGANTGGNASANPKRKASANTTGNRGRKDGTRSKQKCKEQSVHESWLRMPGPPWVRFSGERRDAMPEVISVFPWQSKRNGYRTITVARGQQWSSVEFIGENQQYGHGNHPGVSVLSISAEYQCFGHQIIVSGNTL